MVQDLQLARLLAGLVREFADGLATDALLHAVCVQSPAALGVTGVGVMLRADEELQLSTASDERIARVAALQSRFGEGPCRDALLSGRTVVDDRLGDDSRWPRFGPAAAAAGMRSVVAAPLVVDGDRMGTLEAYRADGVPLDDRPVAAIEVLAGFVATCLAHAEQVDELRRTSARLRHESLHDPLTGLPNRALLLDRLGVALAKARRHPWSPTVLFCDLDGFKAVNDRYGHQAGDRLLVAVATRLRALLRPGDTLARLSGDEFVVVLEDSGGRDEAGVVARRVLDALAHPFVVEMQEVVSSQNAAVGPTIDDRVTVDASIGIATAGDQPVDALGLLRRADEAMYRAKAAGGSRSLAAEEEPPRL